MKYRIYGLLLLSCWEGLLGAHAEQRIPLPDTLKQQQIKEVVVKADIKRMWEKSNVQPNSLSWRCLLI